MQTVISTVTNSRQLQTKVAFAIKLYFAFRSRKQTEFSSGGRIKTDRTFTEGNKKK